MTDPGSEQAVDSPSAEMIREPAFARMVERGLQDSRSERTISNGQMDRRIQSWSIRGTSNGH